MPVTEKELYSIIAERLQTTHLEVIDESGGCGASFKVFIVSPLFEGKGLLDRQRLVNSLLENEMKEIHAFSFKKTITPEEWIKFQAKQDQK